MIIYAISSIHHNYIYVGMTSDLHRRISDHNKGYEKTTRAYAPFSVIYTEECADRKEARRREKYWKGGSGKEKLKALRDSQQE